MTVAMNLANPDVGLGCRFERTADSGSSCLHLDVGVGVERHREIVRRCKVTREFISREFISMDES